MRDRGLRAGGEPVGAGGADAAAPGGDQAAGRQSAAGTVRLLPLPVARREHAHLLL